MAEFRGLWLGNASNAMTHFSRFANLQSHVMDATNDKITWLFHAEEAVTITELFVRPTVVAATSPTFRISLQGGSVKASNGTIKGATNNAKKTFQPSALGWAANTGYWLTLDESYACSRGEYLAIVLEHSSGTPSTDSFLYTWGNSDPSHFMPSCITTDAGVDTQRVYGPFVYGYASSNKSFGTPVQHTTNNVLDLNTTPDEWGLKFTLSSSAFNTFKVASVALRTRFEQAAGTVNCSLYDSGDTLLQQIVYDNDWQASTVDWICVPFDETTLSTLSAGSTYRVIFEPVDATSDLRAYETTFARSQDTAALASGSTWEWTQRTGKGSWTDINTKIPHIMLLLTDITAPAAGGGASIAPFNHGRFGVGVF